VDSYKRKVSEAFDSIANDYDDWLDGSELNAVMRRESLELLERLFRPGSWVLDIGCGTGREAIQLAKGGIMVTATDVSPAMTIITAKKAELAGVGDRVQVRIISAAEIGRLQNEGMRFDGAYSSSGALNCEPDLGIVAEKIATLLKPHSPLVISMVNRLCLSEMILFTIVGRPAKAFRRLAFPAKMTLANGTELETYLHTLRGVTSAFKPGFELVSAKGILVFLPPPYLENQWRRLGILRLPLNRFEKNLAGRNPFSAFGDHYLLQFKRVG